MDVEFATTLYVDDRCTGLRVRRAIGFWSRAAGLWVGQAATAPIALELRPCAAVHTFAMRRSIDVAFVAEDGRVLRTVDGLAPWRVAACRGATSTWELPAGMCLRHGVRPGVRLRHRADAVAPLAAAPELDPPCAAGRVRPRIGA